MSRPPKNKIVETPPLYSVFKPAGIRRRKLPQIILSLDEYEAIRLADFESMEHAKAAQKMEISRSTFTRLIEKARKKVADFLLHGKQLQIEGGVIHFRGNRMRCNDCGKVFNSDLEKISPCPVCGSINLENLAENFGHGRCCRGHRRKI
jgi:predicted DNA-binding protein (UPF0251 family)